MMAYLVMMTPRLVELRRVLKPTGSIYLHCDPTASHYLKVLMDTDVWLRKISEMRSYMASEQLAHHDAKRYGRIH